MQSLPSDVILQITSFLSLADVVSLSLVSKSYYALAAEHSFWLQPLRAARLKQPLACPALDDLSEHTPASLKQLALHALRLAHNWRQPTARVRGPVCSLPCGAHTRILCVLAGARAAVLYSTSEETAMCCDLSAGRASAPVFVGQIVDVAPPLEEPGGWTLAALLASQEIVVFTARVHPLSLQVVCTRALEPGYTHSNIFLPDAAVVGVVRAPAAGDGLQLHSYNMADPEITATVQTDCPAGGVVATAVGDDAVHLFVLQNVQAPVYACPRALLAYACPAPRADYTLRRSHVARIPRPPSDAASGSYAGENHRVLCGAAPISVAQRFTLVPIVDSWRFGPHSVALTFWPRPSQVNAALHPAHTVAVLGTLVRELVAAAPSGRAAVLVVAPLAEEEDDDEEDEDEDADAAPVLMLVQADADAEPVQLQVPAALDLLRICALALDDHIGCVFVVTDDDECMHCIPYA
ncbi:hypothetical protein B0H17DRAFT_1216273 [Mycena rosella]|uniref:F-box domain-containing protein n=1 Tax=Mycena rosella TaxID=1033263 RepID=A0AAD7CA65_MYCRO|nr:hypothetical protein B0H17DRAFT_1216273 [Mycena rosella]